MCFVKYLTVTFSVGCLQKLMFTLFPPAKYDFHNSVSLNAFV